MRLQETRACSDLNCPPRAKLKQRRATILGINAFHGDAAACLVRDGVLIAAAEEERFVRVKHWAGFPEQALRWCLEEAGLEPGDLTHIAINRDPKARLLRKVLYSIRHRPSFELLRARLVNAARVSGAQSLCAAALGVAPGQLRARMHAVEHHRAHLASAFFVSPFETAAVVSIDGFGDFSSAMWGLGRGNSIEVHGQVLFPHSLGLLYLALTQYLGFPKHGDEYQVMGLAAHGKPTQLAQLNKLVRLLPGGAFELNLDYFRHHSAGVAMSFDSGAPSVGRVYSTKLEQLLGPARRPEQPLTSMHRDLAASLQALYEQCLFHLLDAVWKQSGASRLCLAGGCALNSVANGKIAAATEFRELFVQPAAGDAGGALGAAYHVWNQELGGSRGFVLRHAHYGPHASEAELASLLVDTRAELEAARCSCVRLDDEGELCERVADHLVRGHVVGWFQGRMEWGPRALGNRSILGDPRRADMQQILNLKIKQRASFRPFAPSVLAEKAAAWFCVDAPVSFMQAVHPVRLEVRARVPAITHVDGSARLQTVEREHSPRYHRLLQAFEARTGVPLLLNTSFNENEPVVCRPREALDCFLRTSMDVLVLENHVIERSAPAAGRRGTPA